MSGTTRSSNVIDFSKRHEIAHPASKNFELEKFEELLEETSDVKKDNFIYHMKESYSKEIHQGTSAYETSHQVTKKMKRLKESTRRLRFYLDELTDNM
jgi:tRNA A-37 threonylcarbamoyl transferase component Bud32